MTAAPDAEARAKLAAAVPAHVRHVCHVLTAAGHQAVTVGGAVRDALLGRPPGDWDVASSASPDQVMAAFPHTIPTGVQHGTVTVVAGRGGKASHVEVTTFRGEGAYSDARRPDHVVFGVPLVEDLARRDLVVNAIAYDPERDELHDPFGGREDLARRRLRAVGDPVARFTEDGLRVMRAVRFAAQLEFELEPATEAGIGPALPSLAKVSRERVCEELRKTLAARQPSRALAIARRTQILRTILPELDAAIADEPAWLARVDCTPPVRLAALLAPLASRDADPHHLDRDTQRRVLAVLRGLKFSNVECELAAQLVAVLHAERLHDWSLPELRRLLAQLDRDKRMPATSLWQGPLAHIARRVLQEGDPLDVGALAVGGKDLMEALGQPPGPAIGRILAMLLDRVLDDPARNTRDQLLADAQQLELEVGR